MPRPRADPSALEARGAYRKNPARKRTLEELEKAPRLDAEPAPEPTDYVAVAERYAREVVAGKIVACKWVRLACDRHLKDRLREGTAEFPYRFDADAANKFCANIERYPHIKGRWAAKGERIKLEPWQVFFNAVPFGWKRTDNGRRRFREMYICVPRKNAKSTAAAAIGNNMLLTDGEFGAEVYAGATSEKQAWEVFGPARLMLDRDPLLCAEYGVGIWAKAIVKDEDNSKFWPVIGNPGDGSSPSCAIIDEYHEHVKSDLVDTMVTGMGAREQPMLLIITTAGVNLASPCYDKHIEATKILDGVLKNEEIFAIIYGIDEDDDWTSPDAVRKANPNIGVSVDEDFLLAQQRSAMSNPSYQNRFKTKHLNVWCAASVAGINMRDWRACADPTLSLDQFAGERSWFALDLASKIDICCFAKVFKRNVKGANHYYAFVRHYLPEQTIEETGYHAQAYRRWVIENRLVATPGAEIDFDLIRDDVTSFASKFMIEEIVYDPWRATQLAHQLMKDGAKVVEMAQTARNMGEAYDELTSALKGGRFHHNGDPVLEWMASNVVAKNVAKGLTLPSKEKKENKIDGIVAITMAISRAMTESSGVFDDWLKNTVTA